MSRNTQPYPYGYGYPQTVQVIRPRASSVFPSSFSLLIILGILAWGVYLVWNERQGLLGELDKARQTERELRLATARLAVLESEKRALLAVRESLEMNAKLMEVNAQIKDNRLAALEGTYAQLQEQMKAEIAQGDIALSQDGTRLRVDLVDKILFDSGQTRVSRRGANVLARLGSILSKVEGKNIQVLGHTDDRPIRGKLLKRYQSNWELSIARAMTIVRFLEKTGVRPSRLVASGHGQHRPVASNKTAAGRSRNRRIEVLLTPSLAPRPVDTQALASR